MFSLMSVLRLSQNSTWNNFEDRERQGKRKFKVFKSQREEERREQVVDGKRVSEYMIPSIVPNDSKMASCCFFMPPIGKQRMFDISYLLANRLIVEFGQIRKFEFSSISSANCATPPE